MDLKLNPDLIFFNDLNWSPTSAKKTEFKPKTPCNYKLMLGKKSLTNDILNVY